MSNNNVSKPSSHPDADKSAIIFSQEDWAIFRKLANGLVSKSDKCEDLSVEINEVKKKISGLEANLYNRLDKLNEEITQNHESTNIKIDIIINRINDFWAEMKPNSSVKRAIENCKESFKSFATLGLILYQGGNTVVKLGAGLGFTCLGNYICPEYAPYFLSYSNYFQKNEMYIAEEVDYNLDVNNIEITGEVENNNNDNECITVGT